MKMKIDGRPLRVLHILKSSIYSGAESVVITMIKRMSDEYDMMYVATDGEIKTTLQQEKIPHFLLKEFSRKSISDVIKTFRPDIVHAHDFTASVLCASILGRFRLISHLHHNPCWAREWNLKSMVYMISIYRFSNILTVSKNAYDDIVFTKLGRKKMEVMGNPIDVNRICTLGNCSDIIELYDVLFVGRFVNEKNPKAFIEIINKLHKSNHKVRSAMLGTGELWEECRQMIDRYGLQEYIKLLGFQKNPYKYMKASRMICITSEREGYGLVAAESNILGVPVISTRNGGVAEIFGLNALELCDNLAEFPTKIWNVLTDKEEYQKWRRRALERQNSFVSVDDYVSRMKIIYKGN